MPTHQSDADVVGRPDADGVGRAARPPANPDIDPRGPQFTAAVTAVVLVAILATAGTWVGTALTAVQTGLFALGALLGVQRTPTAALFKSVVRPRLPAPGHLEDPAPPRFAQAVGLAFAATALVAFLAGAETVGIVAIGFALVAATLNAVFRFCLGCELFLLIKRVTA